MKFQIIFKNGRDVVFEAKDCIIENDFAGKTSKITFEEPKGTRPVWFRLEDITTVVYIEEEIDISKNTGKTMIHHIDPITVEDVIEGNPKVFDLNNLTTIKDAKDYRGRI